MKSSLFRLVLFTGLLSIFNPVGSQGLVINHTSTTLEQVPVEWIQVARSQFRIWYGHTSHGSQITTGMQNLQSHYGAPYIYNSSGTGGALSYQELTWADLGHNGDLYWEQLTRQQLNSQGNNRNVVIWSWCGGVSDNTVQGINIYLNAMNQLELDYPNVKFVYMTGHLDIWSDANLKARNQQIRDYCISHNKILFDFADIESFNPDGVNFPYASDDCSYYQGPGWGYLGNWAEEWCSAHPGSDLCWNCDCAHSQPLNCNLKGRAFWWMMAKMAGWNPEQSTFYVDKNNPAASDANPGTAALPWLTLQHAVNQVQSGDTVKVAGGTYYENIQIPDNKGIGLFGGFESGNFNQRDPAQHETIIHGSAGSPVVTIQYSGGYGDSQHFEIDGFTLENGQRGILAQSWGNGGTGYLTVSGNIIRNNGGLTGSNDFGGGIHSAGMVPGIVNNQIQGNSCGKGGGIFVDYRSTDFPVRIEGNTIEDNEIWSDHGAGGYVSAYTGIIKTNHFINNTIREVWGWGGGLIIDGNQFAGFSDEIFLELSGNTYSGNTVPSGGSGVFADEGANVRMSNELIVKNICTGSGSSGAVYVDGERADSHARTILLNCTVANNTGSGNSTGHAICVEGGSEVIATNGIFYGNQSANNQTDFYVDASSSLLVDYSIYMNGNSGEGTFFIDYSSKVDPLFADTAAADYHLTSRGGRWNPVSLTWITDPVHSPGIDAGNPASDFSNEPIPNGNRINLGCYGNTLYASKSSAATYQVGPARSYQTLQEVAGLLLPGDIVEVDGDNTYPGGVIFTQPGTASQKITIRGIRINGNRPVLSGGANTVTFSTPWPYTGPEGAHHYVFEGFEVTGGSVRGIFHQAQDLTIRDCLVHDCPAHGILGADQGSGSLLLEYTEVYNCGFSEGRHQIYMATDEVNNPGSVFRMQHCYIHDGNGGNNVKSRAERNEIYYNWIEGAFYHELELIGADEDACGGDQTLVREDSDVVGNVLIKKLTAASNNPDFSVMRIGGDGTGESMGRYRFLNNTIITGTGPVFRIYDALESVEIHNNVFYNPSGDVLFKRTVEANWVTGEEVITGVNNWVKTGTMELLAQLTGTLTGDDPGFMDAAGEVFIPAALSDLLNSGMLPVNSLPGFEFPNPLPLPFKLPPNGGIEEVNTAQDREITGNIDIGAFEYQGGLPYYTISPSSLDFGTVFTGESLATQISIVNESEVPVVIDSIRAEPDVFIIPAFTYPVTVIDSFSLEVMFEPAENLNYSGSLTVYASQSFNKVVPLTGTGYEEQSGSVHVSGEVTGLWAGYDTLFVDGNIIVPLGETLEILPAEGGTAVMFNGPYSISVFGKLRLMGNQADSLTFFALDSETGWEGIRFINTSLNGQGNSEMLYCTFRDGRNIAKADGMGGAISAGSSSNLVISDCKFVNNQAVNGGAIYLSYSSPTISDCEMAYNHAIESGGGIYTGYDSSPQITSLNGHHNIAFEGNGGGVFIQYGSAPVFQYGSISNNTASAGGGIACSSDQAVFSYLDISGNVANGEWAAGGGMACNANPLISNCTISNNYSNGSGGGISCNFENSPVIEYCTFTGNQAQYGGGMACLYSSGPRISHSWFRNNEAYYGYGGGMYVWEGSEPVLHAVEFESNYAKGEGGALFIYNASGTYTNIVVKNNQCDVRGGGIWVGYHSSPVFYNGLIYGNNSDWGGGMIFLQNTGQPVLHNLTLSGNHAHASGGGIACDGGSPKFYSTIFWGNTAVEQGNNVYLHVPESDPFFNYCLIKNGVAGFGGDGSGSNYDISRYLNNLEINPQFVSPTENNYNLMINSPAINHGLYDTTGFYLPAVDLNGNSRIADYLLDMGCYENQDYGSPQQTLVIPAGWSGISSFLIPYFPQLEQLFEPVGENLVILQNPDGVYWPGQNINTLGSWNPDKGYLVRLLQSASLTIPGILNENLSLDLAAGWNLIPVLNSCGITAAEVFSQLGYNLVMIAEPAGTGIFWPKQNVYLLDMLESGKSYYMLVTNSSNLNFAECDVKK